MPRGEVADIERIHRVPRDLHHLPLREEPLGEASLIEHLDHTGMQAAGTRAHEVRACTPLDDRDIDPGQRQLAASIIPVGPAPAITTACEFIHVVITERARSS